MLGEGQQQVGLLCLGLLCILHPSLYCVCRKAPKLESRLGQNTKDCAMLVKTPEFSGRSTK